MILQFGTFEFLQINVKKEPIEDRDKLCLFTLSPHYEAPSSMCIAPAAINQLGQDQCPASICDSNQDCRLERQTFLGEEYAKFYNHGEGPYSWLKVPLPTSDFTFKTLC